MQFNVMSMSMSMSMYIQLNVNVCSVRFQFQCIFNVISIYFLIGLSYKHTTHTYAWKKGHCERKRKRRRGEERVDKSSKGYHHAFPSSHWRSERRPSTTYYTNKRTHAKTNRLSHNSRSPTSTVPDILTPLRG